MHEFLDENLKKNFKVQNNLGKSAVMHMLNTWTYIYAYKHCISLKMYQCIINNIRKFGDGNHYEKR